MSFQPNNDCAGRNAKRLPANRPLRTVSAPPTAMPPDSSPLTETLRRRRFEAMQADAELARDHPDGDERMQEAKRLVREAMYCQTLGRITLAERDRILDTLSFAVEAMRPKGEGAPAAEHDQVCPPSEA